MGDTLYNHRVAGMDKNHHGIEIRSIKILDTVLIDEALLNFLLSQYF